MNAPRDMPPDMPFDDDVSRLRVPPHSVSAEQSVLGALLLDNSAWDRVGDMLVESQFYVHENRLIFAAIRDLVNACKPADIVTVFERLRTARGADEAGGLLHLNALVQSVTGSANIRAWAAMVQSKALLRATIAKADEIATEAFQGVDAGQLLDKAQVAFTELGRNRKVREPVAIGDLLSSRLDRYNDLAAGNIPPGISTGKPRLDVMLGGGLRTGLYVVAARPSIGKSSWAADIGMHVAESTGKPVLFDSQEMSAGRIADRAIARMGGVRLQALITGTLTGDEWRRTAEAVDRLHRMPFLIDDEPAQRLIGIRRKARAIKGIALLVVDYLQLCGTDLKTDNRNLQIEELTRGLKALSTELDIPVLALSQLNRSVESRSIKRPNLGDLRDSGAIEQDADVVLFLWPARENFDDKRAGVKIVGVGVDKNRDGALGELSMEFRGAYQQWDESDVDPSPRPVSAKEAAGSFE